MKNCWKCHRKNTMIEHHGNYPTRIAYKGKRDQPTLAEVVLHDVKWRECFVCDATLYPPEFCRKMESERNKLQ